MNTRADFDAYALHKIELLSRVDNEDVPVRAVIRKPFECGDRRWSCAASISGLFHRKADLERDSAEEAIRAARGFVLDELSEFAADGGQLFTMDHRPVTDLRTVLRQKHYSN